jgi:MSHA biogenesis protein MshP
VADEFGAGCANPLSKEFTGIPGLEGCGYQVAPVSKSIQDGGKNFTYWTFSSVGQCTAGGINVTRTVYVDAMVDI